MTRNLLPKDLNGFPVDALRLVPGGSQTITVTATSARNATPFEADDLAIAVYATQNCFIRTGNSAVTAATTDHFLPAGVFVVLALKSHTHLAAIRQAADGVIYISELE